MTTSSSFSSSSPPPQSSKITAPYGSWKSPISADLVSGAEKQLAGFAVAGDGRLVWAEARPNEDGRVALVKEAIRIGDEPLDILPPEFAARDLVYEYGGGAFAVWDDQVIFSNYEDQRLHKQTIGDHLPVAITPDYGGSVVRYADGVFDRHSSRYITVMEDHRQSSLNPITSIVAIKVIGGTVEVPKELVSGNDFYAFPRIDLEGKRMAWVEWSHPNMHWDRAELWVGYFSENGDVHKRLCVAGGDLSVVESPTEPKWSAQGDLFFMTDRKSGFWNIYRWAEQTNDVVPVYSLDAEFSKPSWVFGVSSYDFIQDGEDNHHIACSYRQNRRSYLGILDYVQGSFSSLDIPLTDINNLVSGFHCLYIEGASATTPMSIAKVTLGEDLLEPKEFSLIWSSFPEIMELESYFSLPEIIEFPTEVLGEKAYAYFYSPSNCNYQASSDEKPPLLLESHGGPTDNSRGILNLNVQYWTSRGWAFVDVNYGGSSGYGREYRERLSGRWGVVDVNDCCSCAKFLVENGKVDGRRLCIRGMSAGGYTALSCLAFRDIFKAGASLFGIADLASLKAEMHKFESCYIDKLVGDEKAFFERSPINFVDNFTCPAIFFQGLDDKVVSPNQARKMYSALKEKGLPVALVEYEGEQHGFRKAENIKFTLEQQMMFLARIVGNFNVADEIAPIKIDNLD